jgi:Ca2+-binding RTX toxin-like protein
VVLNGDYSAGVAFSKTTMINVESIVLTSGFSYKLATNDTTVAAGQTLTVDASQLGAANFLNFDGSAETNGTFVIIGGAGSDIVKGGAGADKFTMTAGGDDTVAGGDGDDTFDFGGAFTAKDRIDGGKGSDTVLLNGDYSAGVVFQAATMINVESLILGKGHSYNLPTDDATVAAGQKLTVDGSQLLSGDVLIFNGSAEKDGSFVLIGGQGNDTLTGGGAADVFDLSHGGNDAAKGGGGADIFQMGAALTAADKIDGGDGKDTVVLDGDYSQGLTFGATTMIDVETLRLTNGHSYKLAMSDGNVADGQTLTIDASKLGGGFALTFDGSAEHDGAFVVKGGRGDDHMIGGDGADKLTGGKGNDVLQGGNGADLLNGGRGDDIFAYTAVAQSTGPVFDTIAGFSAKQDKIDVWFAVTGVDKAVAHGALSLASFNSDLATALGAAQLAGSHAIVFTPDSGDLAGDTFLVVDANGVAGYQAGQDLVIQLDHAAHLNQLTVSDFI